MAQHDYIIKNASGAIFRQDLNNALAAIATNNSGATQPTPTYAGQFWLDTSTSPATLRLRNTTNNAWINCGNLNELGFISGLTSNAQTQINAKANLASPALTGIPTAPTAAVGTNTTQLATTEFVQAGFASLTGNQTIAGIKTFSSSPVIPAATLSAQAVNLGQINVSNSEPVKTALNASGAAPIYACRAWVNFNGTGTVAIRASGNVSSITDNGVGDYTVNFTTAMPDANYSLDVQCSALDVISQANEINIISIAVGKARFRNVGTGVDLIDRDFNKLSVHR